jgi:hypothetical protein
MAGSSPENASAPPRAGIGVAKKRNAETEAIPKGQGDSAWRQRRLNEFLAKHRHFSVIR